MPPRKRRRSSCQPGPAAGGADHRKQPGYPVSASGRDRPQRSQDGIRIAQHCALRLPGGRLFERTDHVPRYFVSGRFRKNVSRRYNHTYAETSRPIPRFIVSSPVRARPVGSRIEHPSSRTRPPGRATTRASLSISTGAKRPRRNCAGVRRSIGASSKPRVRDSCSWTRDLKVVDLNSAYAKMVG